MLSFNDALEAICQHSCRGSTETIKLKEALGCVVAEPHKSTRSIPFTDNSAMDGYGFAWEAAQLMELPVVRHMAAGDALPHNAVPEGSCCAIMTGASIPLGVDTVIPREQVEGDGTEKIKLKKLPPKGSNIRSAGEDIAEGETLDLRGRPLGPGDLGVLASIGIQEVRVYKKPRVGFFSTGEELIEPDEKLVPGKVVNSNAWTLKASIELAGAEAVYLGKAGDSVEETVAVYQRAADCDMVLSTGGVSMGDHDHVIEAMEKCGMEIKFWKVAIKPGKPLVYARWGERSVFGLPGNPVSGLVNFELFVRMAIKKFKGVDQIRPEFFDVVLKEAFPSAKNRLNLVRAVLSQKEGRYEASLTGSQGSGVLRSMSLANALVCVDKEMGPGERAKAIWISGKAPWL